MELPGWDDLAGVVTVDLWEILPRPRLSEPTRAAKPPPQSPLALVPRLRSRALLANSPRIDWASLLRRTFNADVLESPKCARRLRVLGIVDDPETVHAILSELAIAPSMWSKLSAFQVPLNERCESVGA